MADSDGVVKDTAENKAGAATVDNAHRQSRPSSANRGRERPKSLGHTLHWFAHVGSEPEMEPDYIYLCNNSVTAGEEDTTHHLDDEQDNFFDGDAGARDSSAISRDREERIRLVREKQNTERARKLEELRAQALAAQRYREQKEEERRRRIDEMRNRDSDRRQQVEERKRAILEAEKERREAIVRRNEERDARLEGRRKSGTAGVFAFGSSTPRMLEPADTGGTFWGHRRATSTSNMMFAALPLSRRSSERDLDPNKKRASSACGLDRQPGEEDSHADSAHMFSSVARRKTDLVPTIPISRSDVRTPRSPGRAYSMTRLDQLARPRCPISQASKDASPKDIQSPVRPPRHRSSGQLSRVPGHRSVGNLTLQGPSPPPRKPKIPASGLRSGEITPSSPSRPGSSLSSVSTVAGSTTNSAMTSSVMGSLINRRPRATPRRPRPVSIAGTGVTTPPHAKNDTVGPDGKPVGTRAEKPPLPRVHSAGNSARKPTPAATTPTGDKPEAPKRVHKAASNKTSPRVTPKATPLQSPAIDVVPPPSESPKEIAKTASIASPTNEDTTTINSQTTTVSQDNEITTTTVVEQVKTVTKESEVEKAVEQMVVTSTAVDSNSGIEQPILEAVEISQDSNSVSEILDKVEESSSSHDKLVEEMNNLNIMQSEVVSKEDSGKPVSDNLPVDLLDGADMTASMSARSKITTEEEAKAALAERRRLAREEAERQAEKERLRLEKEAAEEAERQRQEEERLRRLEEETIRLSELQRQAEEERLQQAIQEAQRRAEEEKQKREEEAKARIEREAAEAKAREEAEKLRKETAERLRKEEEEREARRKRVEAIMLRTRQAKQKKDGDKSPSEENKSIEEVDLQKSVENKIAMDISKDGQKSQEIDSRSAYEISVREREQDLFNHMAPHNQTGMSYTKPPENGSNGISHIQNGKPTNGDTLLSKMDDDQTNNYAVQNGHSKSQINELNNLINTSENQFNNMALDNNVILNNVSTDLLDISNVDLLNTTNKNNPFMADVNTNNGGMQSGDTNIGQLLDFTADTISKTFGEDAVNSNESNNSSFIKPFHDNQENRDLSLL